MVDWVWLAGAVLELPVLGYLVWFHWKHKRREANRILGKERAKLLAILAEMDKEEQK